MKNSYGAEQAPSTRRTRLFRHVVAGSAALALLGSGTAFADLPVSSTEDVTAPQVSAVSVAPLSVDVTDGLNKTMTVDLTATDDLSGVQYVSLYYSGPAGSGSGISFGVTRVSGDALNGTYRGTSTVTPLHANGTYKLSSLRVQDVVGNYRYYSATDSVAPAALEVKSSADAVPPVITGLSVSPNPVDVSAQGRRVDVTVEATDDASGVSSVYGYFYSPTSRQSASFFGQPASGTNASSASVFIRRYSDPGDWTLSSLCAVDKAGNRHCLSPWSTPKLADAFPEAASLEVTSDPADLQKPVLEAFRVLPGGIDVTHGSQTVAVEFDVADDLSGVQYATASFSSPRTAGATPEVITRRVYGWAPAVVNTVHTSQGTWTTVEDETKRMLKGTLTGKVSFPQYDRSGDWTLSHICVVDQVNWQTCYSGAELATKGTPTLVVKWNRAPVPTISGITQDSYSAGQQPTPTCTATDVEDGATDVEQGILLTSISTSEPDADGKVTVTCTVTDSGGRTGTATASYLLLKNVAPTLEGHPATLPDGKNGWYISDVTIDWTAADEDGNLDAATVPADEVIATEGADQTVTATVSDLAGLSATATSAPAVSIDKTAPAIAFTGNAGTYSLTDTISIGCSITDAVSGVATQSCAGVDGPAWQHAPGGEATAAAEDVAGNATTSASSFTVTVDALSLCELVKQFSSNAGVARSLCSKLDNAAAADARGDAEAADRIRGAFVNEVAAQSGKALAADEADVLTRLVALI